MRRWMKERREAKGLTLKQAGEALDVSESYYKLIEDGSRQIPGDLLFRVSSTNGSDETHVGLYCGRGVVIHDKGRDVGVVCEGINESGSGYWHKCGRLKMLYT